MKPITKLLAVSASSLLLLIACGGGSGNTIKTVNPPPALVGYYTNWSIYGANYQPSDIPSNVDEVSYAFFQVGDCNPNALGTETAPTCVRGGKVGTTTQYTYTGNQDYKLSSIDPYADFDPTYVNSTGYQNWGGKSTIARALKTGKKVMASIGGYSSGVYIRNAIEPQNRSTFVPSIVQFLKDQERSAENNADTTIRNSNKFYGVDVDWEPNGNYWTMPAQAAGNYQLQKVDLDNYLAFLTALKQAMSAAGYQKLSIAISANPDVLTSVETIYGGNYWSSIAALGIDIKLMTYDFYAQDWAGSCTYTGFNSAVSQDSADPCNRSMTITNSVSKLASYGVPKAQIGIGAPAYGRAWSLTSANKALVTSQNPYVSFDNSTATSVYNSLNADSTWTYRTIVTNHLYGVTPATNANSLAQNTTWSAIGTSSAAMQTYATTQVRGATPAWISYSAPTDVFDLGKWARAEGLNSVMLWSLDGDVQPNDAGVTDWYQSSLVYNLYKGLNQ